MKEYVPPLEIAAESCMNNSGETVLTLYGDHGVPDIIVCDRKRYIQEPTVGIVGAWAEKIKEACGVNDE